MGFKSVMLPPQSEITRGWARRFAAAVPEAEIVVAEGAREAQQAIADAGGVFGTLTPDLLRRAGTVPRNVVDKANWF